MTITDRNYKTFYGVYAVCFSPVPQVVQSGYFCFFHSYFCFLFINFVISLSFPPPLKCASRRYVNSFILYILTQFTFQKLSYILEPAHFFTMALNISSCINKFQKMNPMSLADFSYCLECFTEKMDLSLTSKSTVSRTG